MSHFWKKHWPALYRELRNRLHNAGLSDLECDLAMDSITDSVWRRGGKRGLEDLTAVQRYAHAAAGNQIAGQRARRTRRREIERKFAQLFFDDNPRSREFHLPMGKLLRAAAAMEYVIRGASGEPRFDLTLLTGQPSVITEGTGAWVEGRLHYWYRLVHDAPFAEHTVAAAWQRVEARLANARRFVAVSMADAPADMDLDLEDELSVTEPASANSPGNKVLLTGEVNEGMTLLRWLFPRMKPSAAVDHARKIAAAVLGGLDPEGTRLAFRHKIYPYGNEDMATRLELRPDLRSLYRQGDGSLTISHPDIRDLSMILTCEEEGVVSLSLPGEEMLPGDEGLTEAGHQVLLDEGFQPPDEHSPYYQLGFEIKKVEHLEYLLELGMDLCAEVYGWDPVTDDYVSNLTF